MKNSACLTDRFTPLIEQTIFNYVSSRIFLEVMSRKPTQKDFSFFMRCKSLSFMTMGDMIQKIDPEDNILYMEHYLDNVIGKLKQIDDGGSVYMVIRCIEQSIIAIADLFHIVLGFKTPAGSEVEVSTHTGHHPDPLVLHREGQSPQSPVNLLLPRPDDDQRRTSRQGRLQLHPSRDRHQVECVFI